MAAHTPKKSPIEFHDLDQKDVYDKVVGETDSEKARNFVVEFSHQQATIAFDLSADDFRILLGHEPPDGVIRWINVWSPSTQRPAVECIGTHYSFSSRLQALMTSATKASMAETTTSVQRVNHADVEAGSSSTEVKSASPNDARVQMSEDIEIYHLVKETMNYTSIDHGKQFLCIGANWLHRRPINPRHAKDKTGLLPPKHWSWLTLCSNSVVLSLHETPPYVYPEDAKLADEELRGMRSNTMAVLRQLSKHGVDDYSNSVITLKSVRQALPTAGPGCNAAREGSSNLYSTPFQRLNIFIRLDCAECLKCRFFYLFEDYSGAREKILASNSRRSKLKSGDVIRPLHTLRRELRQLHHLFESYKSLIRRICRPRCGDGHKQCPCAASESLGGLSDEVKISSSARGRFERLEDRLQLLMLNTMHEYLDELDALSNTYFNLTAQKDSQATARLSRSATLLAKLSVFFLPISFMTSYFSVEIPGLVEHYTPKMYWICFAVIAGLSFVSLFFFSRMLEFVIDVLEAWTDSVTSRFLGIREPGERNDD
ncbi:ADP-ribosylation factor [Colletotrichum asianum]|uniref:ADP-ribosylation factor n=1 Tax=Colletotrichum asianum TaxID=702518 RepID=A0A8H3ZGX0_9PEZI|nr:ADP-ribosylation factor [Colletotrichum asianum]